MDEPTRQEIDTSPQPTVIEFGAGWCGYCQAAQADITAALSKRPTVRHIKVEDGKGRPLGRSFKVKLWPTLVYLENGAEVGRVVRPNNVARDRSDFQRSENLMAWSARACMVAALLACGVAAAQSDVSDTDEAAYAPSTLAKIMGGAARSQNDEAELAPPGQWYTTTATFTGQKRQPSSRFRPLISSWMGSRGQSPELVDMFFGGELPELQFEQGGKKYWLMGGLPGGLGFDVYPPGQKLSIYLQRVGFASGTPVAVLTLVKLPGGVTSTTVPAGRRMHNTRMGEGARRQESTFKTGSATFTYAGREYSLPLDASGRHSVTPGFYSYENGVRTALLEYGSGDDRYLLIACAGRRRDGRCEPRALSGAQRAHRAAHRHWRVLHQRGEGAALGRRWRCGLRRCAARGVLEASLHRRVAAAGESIHSFFVKYTTRSVS